MSQNTTQQHSISDEMVFKVSKEIVVKFIEAGRLTPSNFEETFERVYKSIHTTLQAHASQQDNHEGSS